MARLPSSDSVKRASRLAVQAVVVTLVFVGCSPSPATWSASSSVDGASSGSFTTDSSFARGSAISAPVSLDPPPAYVAELSNLNKDGTRSKDSALKLFAMTYGSLPGVSADRMSHGFVEGTAAISAVRAHWEELTQQQRDAVDKLMAPTGAMWEVRPDGSSSQIQPDAPKTRHSLRSPALPGLTDPPELVAMVRSAEALIRPKLGIAPPIIRVGYGTPNSIAGGGPSLADSDAQFFNGVGLAWCTIRIGDDIASRGQVSLFGTMVHEVFHCFQAALSKTHAVRKRIPAWVDEGTAEWVESDLVGDPINTGWWTIYLRTPQRNLYERTYDAIGFWAHLKQAGTDPWLLFPALFSAAGATSDSLYETSGASSTLSIWASSVAQDSARGPAWRLAGNALPGGVGSPVNAVTVDPEHPTATISNQGLSTSLTRVASRTEIISFGRATGSVRINDGLSDRAAPGEFCASPSGCECPEAGSESVAPPFIAGNILVALSGDASIYVVGQSLQDFCKKFPATPTPPPTPQPGGSAAPWCAGVSDREVSAAIGMTAVGTPSVNKGWCLWDTPDHTAPLVIVKFDPKSDLTASEHIKQSCVEGNFRPIHGDWDYGCLLTFDSAHAYLLKNGHYIDISVSRRVGEFPGYHSSLEALAPLFARSVKR